MLLFVLLLLVGSAYAAKNGVNCNVNCMNNVSTSQGSGYGFVSTCTGLVNSNSNKDILLSENNGDSSSVILMKVEQNNSCYIGQLTIFYNKDCKNNNIFCIWSYDQQDNFSAICNFTSNNCNLTSWNRGVKQSELQSCRESMYILIAFSLVSVLIFFIMMLGMIKKWNNTRTQILELEQRLNTIAASPQHSQHADSNSLPPNYDDIFAEDLSPPGLPDYSDISSGGSGSIHMGGSHNSTIHFSDLDISTRHPHIPPVPRLPPPPPPYDAVFYRHSSESEEQFSMFSSSSDSESDSSTSAEAELL